MANKKLPLWRRIRRRAYWLLLIILLNLAGFLPITVGRKLGIRFARFSLKFRRRDRALALKNISLAYPDMDAHDRNRLLTESVDALGSNFFDILIGGKLVGSDQWVRDEADFCSDQESVVETLSQLMAEGKGVLILSGHLGCWELSGGALARLWQERFSKPLDLSVVTGTVHNPAVNRIVSDRRRQFGVKILPRQEGIKPLLAALDRGAVVAVLLDQNAAIQNVPVPFFGHPAPTASGFARVALKRGLPVLPVVMARRDQGHIIRHLPALDARKYLGPAGERGLQQQVNFLSACNHQLEILISRNPKEWVWFHDRWESASQESDNKHK